MTCKNAQHAWELAGQSQTAGKPRGTELDVRLFVDVIAMRTCVSLGGVE